ncbi:hypothetical protein [Paracoccus yeei]|uniref:hypothetical protein n=1 Tax=Paracoccus yeei TaxID=147645 RepID=UPI001C8D88F6|nr:hypothetical protein [Paracoccus yeei]MBY0137505.1 hypothetical protein [Paracoccus yeei]
MTHHIDQNAILQIRFYAESAAENAGAAYWAESHRAFLIDRTHEAIAKLANAAGYALVPLASEAPAEEAA